MQQRYYDPSIDGRFPSVDPVTPISPGGTFNRYWYANNNPYKFTDPDGRQSKRKAHADRERGSFCNTGCNAGSFGAAFGATATWGGRATTAAVTAGTAATAAAAVGGALLAYSGEAGADSDQPPAIFYHGTGMNHGLALLNGAPLSPRIATSQNLHGLPGFYLATHSEMAAVFASYRHNPVVLRYTIRMEALTICYQRVHNCDQFQLAPVFDTPLGRSYMCLLWLSPCSTC